MQDPQIATLIITLIIALVILLVCREVTCWYFKINELNRKIDTTNKTLADIRDLLAHSAAPSAAPAPLPHTEGSRGSAMGSAPQAIKGISSEQSRR